MEFQLISLIGRGLLLFIICICLAIKQIFNAIYKVLIEQYFRNFTNEDIDTKIFSTKVFYEGVLKVVFGSFASFLLTKMSTGDAFIVLGIIFGLMILFASIYMKFNLGFKLEDYPENEIYKTYQKKCTEPKKLDSIN